MKIQLLVAQYGHRKAFSSFTSSLTIAIMPKNNSKEARIEWTDEEAIKLLNWMEDNLDTPHQPPRWPKLCKLEEFGQNENIMAERVKYKSGNMKKTFYKLRDGFQKKLGLESRKETVMPQWQVSGIPRLAVINADKPRPQVC